MFHSAVQPIMNVLFYSISTILSSKQTIWNFSACEFLYILARFFVLKTLKKYNILFGFSQDFYFSFDNGPVQSLNSPMVKHSMEIIDFVASLLRYPTALWFFNYQFTECIWLNRVNTTTSTKNKKHYILNKKKIWTDSDFLLHIFFFVVFSSFSSKVETK